MKFIGTIQTDLNRICKFNFINFMKTYFFPRGGCFRYVFWLRMMYFVKKNKLLKLFIGGGISNF